MVATADMVPCYHNRAGTHGIRCIGPAAIDALLFGQLSKPSCIFPAYSDRIQHGSVVLAVVRRWVYAPIISCMSKKNRIQPPSKKFSWKKFVSAGKNMQLESNSLGYFRTLSV